MTALTIEEARELVALFGKHTVNQLDVARKIATAAVEEYGDFPSLLWERFADKGIWNDHSSVQASLATIRLFLPLLDAIDPVIEEGERIIREYGGDRPDHQYQPLMIQMGDLKKLLDIYRGRAVTDTGD